MAFDFPNPPTGDPVTNPETGITYEYDAGSDTWVVTASTVQQQYYTKDEVDNLIENADAPAINEGETPPTIEEGQPPQLWYNTNTLELYFYYCDANDICAWVPTATPITMLEDLDNTVFELRTDITQVNLAVRQNENAIGRTIYFSDSPPAIYDDIDSGNKLADGTPIMLPNELNYKFWYDTDRLELLVLYKDPDDGVYSYVPVSIPLESLPDPGVSTEVFTYTTGRLQTAIDENYAHNLTQDLLIEDLQAQIDALRGTTTTRTMLQYDRYGTKPASFSTNSVSLGSMTTIIFEGTTIQDEQVPSLNVGDTITLTGKTIGGRATLDVTEVVDQNHYKIQPRSNSNALEQDAIYLVNFTQQS